MLVLHMKILHSKLLTENGNIHTKEDLDVNFIIIFFSYGFISNGIDIEDNLSSFSFFFIIMFVYNYLNHHFYGIH